MRLFSVSLAGLAIILSSCAPPPPGQVGLEPANAQSVSAVAEVADGSCNAEIYKNLIGEPISVVNSLNPGVRVRVLAADSFVTRDYNPNRLTFTTTRQDTVGRVFCG
ncbi:MAG: I78 family peptidase inhibitor [Rhodobacteraceae bacterium]|nr:I78 family peptidase inhibitor [Paracoccaceae bacterium]